MPEVWLRGPLPDVPSLLQPVAHGLMQCREEVAATLGVFPSDKLWISPSAATIGYHVLHAIGSLDRLFTYARAESLSKAQLEALSAESQPHAELDGPKLIELFDAAIGRALDQIRRTDEATLLDVRKVGRGQLPSTVIGLLFHAAEHTQRHVGQMVTTAKILGAAAG
jgi:uncharacterized damage-inducible protein DinB